MRTTLFRLTMIWKRSELRKVRKMMHDDHSNEHDEYFVVNRDAIY